MKTPRDLLLERHRQRSPALDRLRERVIAQELGAGNVAIRQGRTGFPEPVCERTERTVPTWEPTAKVAPASNKIAAGALSSASPPAAGAAWSPARDRLPACPALLARWFTWLNWQRAAWSGFAAVWCVILGLNLAAEREMGTGAAASRPIDSAQFLAGLQENRAQLAALLFDQENENESTNRKPEPGSRSDAGRIRLDPRHLNTALV
jgi:hypothetical protein